MICRTSPAMLLCIFAWTSEASKPRAPAPKAGARQTHAGAPESAARIWMNSIRVGRVITTRLASFSMGGQNPAHGIEVMPARSATQRHEPEPPCHCRDYTWNQVPGNRAQLRIAANPAMGIQEAFPRHRPREKPPFANAASPRQQAGYTPRVLKNRAPP